MLDLPVEGCHIVKCMCYLCSLQVSHLRILRYCEVHNEHGSATWQMFSHAKHVTLNVQSLLGLPCDTLYGSC